MMISMSTSVVMSGQRASSETGSNKLDDFESRTAIERVVNLRSGALGILKEQSPRFGGSPFGSSPA